MACVVSISFSTPLCARKFLLQELQLRKVPLAGLSSQATIRTATNLLAFYHSNRDIFSVRSCRGYLTSLDHFGELFPLCTIVMKFDAAIQWLELMEAALMEIILYRENHHFIALH
ncbi:uncharacterized protein LOC110659747 isoform X3 [Hevea brasiliensis]|uniref:uncharacterized protein LOC110659747 isoform X3 n=1 Tax=Hevea brasiliensis TaxID=3981 RepID=UPI0025CEDD17|nr:uncharacterized protein LOC110659747 isoform X3 [Hevea brasiliensis]